MSTQHKQYVSEVAEQINKWLRRKSIPLSDAWRIAALVLMHLDLQPAKKHLLPLSGSGTAENVDAHGRPICPAGLVMRRLREHRTRHRIYYNCPVKRPTHRNAD